MIRCYKIKLNKIQLTLTIKVNIKKKIKKYLFNLEINRRISQYKYVHIMFNDKFNKPFVDFFRILDFFIILVYNVTDYNV